VPNTIRQTSKTEWLRESVIDQPSPLRQIDVITTSELCVNTVQIVGTTHEVIAVGDVSDDAILWVRNISTTATISIGGDAAGSFVEWFFLAPGDPEACFGRVGALASTYLKSTAANTPIAIRLVKIVAP
jgi:hypothetical protein